MLDIYIPTYPEMKPAGRAVVQQVCVCVCAMRRKRGAENLDVYEGRVCHWTGGQTWKGSSVRRGYRIQAGVTAVSEIRHAKLHDAS